LQEKFSGLNKKANVAVIIPTPGSSKSRIAEYARLITLLLSRELAL